MVLVSMSNSVHSELEAGHQQIRYNKGSIKETHQIMTRPVWDQVLTRSFIEWLIVNDCMGDFPRVKICTVIIGTFLI